MSDDCHIEAAVNAGAEAADLCDRHAILDDEALEQGVPLVLLNEGQRIDVLSEVVDAFENRKPNPTRRGGRSTHTEVDSFIDHVNRYKEARSTIWANQDRCSFVCVFNDTPAGDDPSKAGWADHQSHYNCPLSVEWKAWTEMDGAEMSQDQFATWIEDHCEQVASEGDFPTPTALLEMARDLQIHTQGTFQRKVDPSSGQYSMVCKEEHDSSSTKIPRAFVVGLAVFEGGAPYRVEARIKFAMRSGRPVFSYKLHRRAEIHRDAFGDVVEKVAEETEVVVFKGTR